MPNNETVNVEYDRTGVPLPDEGNKDGFSSELSAYLYPKIPSMDNNDGNGNVEFDANEIRNYNISLTNNNKIDISTTRKLINYLKSLIKKAKQDLSNAIEEVDDKLAGKLNISDYVIDNELKNNSDNPVSNKTLYNKFGDVSTSLESKSNVGHTHEISQINNLESSISKIDSKANAVDLTNHKNNTNNPHNVTLEQLGIKDTGWDEHPYQYSSIFDNTIYCRKIGKIVLIKINAGLGMKVKKGNTVITLKSDYCPNFTVKGIAYKVGTGASFTYEISKNTGILSFGVDINEGEKVRIHDLYFTA